MATKNTGNNSPLVECVVCYAKFSLADILSGKYFINTNVCAACYRKAARSPFTVSCFGKKTSEEGYGFNPKALACKRLCPDRLVCRGVVKKKIIIEPINTRAAAKKIGKPADKKVRQRSSPFRSGTAIGKAFDLVCKGCTVQEFDKLVQKLSCNKYRLLRVFRKETAYGFSWTWKERDGKYRISSLS